MPRVAAYFLHSIGRYLPQTRYLRSSSSDDDATLNTSLTALATDKDQTNRGERIVIDVVEWSWGLVELDSARSFGFLQQEQKQQHA
ncbi:hypothetical protein MMC31_001892 [Peltigera leucophlebia]|nr:hypothetical protein [Peltigera leucophlebia]